MCRMTTRSKPGAPPQYSGLPSIISDSFGFQERSLNGPDPADAVLSHSCPRSPFCSCSSASFRSITEPTVAVRQ